MTDGYKVSTRKRSLKEKRQIKKMARLGKRSSNIATKKNKMTKKARSKAEKGSAKKTGLPSPQDFNPTNAVERRKLKTAIDAGNKAVKKTESSRKYKRLEASDERIKKRRGKVGARYKKTVEKKNRKHAIRIANNKYKEGR